MPSDELITTVAAVSQAQSAEIGVWIAIGGVVINAGVVLAALFIPRWERSLAGKEQDVRNASAAETCEIALANVTGFYDWLQKCIENGAIAGGELNRWARTLDGNLLSLDIQMSRTELADILDLAGRTVIVLRRVRADIDKIGDYSANDISFEPGSRLHTTIAYVLNHMDSMTERVQLTLDASAIRMAYRDRPMHRRRLDEWFANRRAMRRVPGVPKEFS